MRPVRALTKSSQSRSGVVLQTGSTASSLMDTMVIGLFIYSVRLITFLPSDQWRKFMLKKCSNETGCDTFSQKEGLYVCEMCTLNFCNKRNGVGSTGNHLKMILLSAFVTTWISTIKMH